MFGATTCKYQNFVKSLLIFLLNHQQIMVCFHNINANNILVRRICCFSRVYCENRISFIMILTIFNKSNFQYYTPKRQKPNTQLFKQHTCSPKCRDLISCSIKRLVAYNPLAKPLLCGFHRLLYKYKSRKHIVYKAPCGRILRNMPELHKYLWTTKSVLTVDFFNFEVHIRCLAEYFLDDDIQLLNKDLSAGKFILNFYC